MAPALHSTVKKKSGPTSWFNKVLDKIIFLVSCSLKWSCRCKIVVRNPFCPYQLLIPCILCISVSQILENKNPGIENLHEWNEWKTLRLVSNWSQRMPWNFARWNRGPRLGSERWCRAQWSQPLWAGWGGGEHRWSIRQCLKMEFEGWDE